MSIDIAVSRFNMSILIGLSLRFLVFAIYELSFKRQRKHLFLSFVLEGLDIYYFMRHAHVTPSHAE